IRKIRLLYGIDGHADNEQYQMLVEDLRAHRYAGVIFAATPFQYVGLPLLDDPQIARAASMSFSDTFPQVAQVRIDPTFAERAVEYLQSRGRRRIACLSNDPRAGLENCRQALKRHGLEIRSYWQQVISHVSPEPARQ